MRICDVRTLKKKLACLPLQYLCVTEVTLALINCTQFYAQRPGLSSPKSSGSDQIRIHHFVLKFMNMYTVYIVCEEKKSSAIFL